MLNFLNLYDQGESNFQASENFNGCPQCSCSHCLTEINLLEIIAVVVIGYVCLKALISGLMEARLWYLKKKESRRLQKEKRYRLRYSPSAPTGVTIEPTSAMGPSTSAISYAGASTSSLQPTAQLTEASGGGAQVAPTLSFVDS